MSQRPGDPDPVGQDPPGEPRRDDPDSDRAGWLDEEASLPPGSDGPLPSSDYPLPDDDELLEAAAVAEEVPMPSAATPDGRALYPEGEEIFIDGTSGRSDLAAERDEYRDALMRVKADFDNYKKRASKEHSERVARAAEGVMTNILPVLDACDAAITQGSSDVEPIFKSLIDVLEKEGLERMEPAGQPFDPAQHEAVLHEPGESDELIVLESLRTGYLWKGRVIRPAMVKVQG